MKKTVVVIDDKPIIRRSIIQTIDWEGLGCEVAGEAADGEEGLKLLEGVRPDIIITDIHMPGLTGLALAEWMNEHLPHAKAILITGYQEFEFAKQAVRLGVFDFIVKPFQNTELTRVIQSAVEKIDEERRQAEQAEQLRREVNRLESRHASTLPEMRAHWAERLMLYGETDDAERSRAIMRELGIEFSRYALLAFRPALADAAGGAVWREKQEELGEVAERLCRDAELEPIRLRMHGDLIVVCLFPRIPEAREAMRKLHGIAAAWLEQAEGIAAISFRAAYGSVYRLAQEMQMAYRELEGLLESGFFRSDETILAARIGAPGQRRAEKAKTSIMQDIERYERNIERMPDEEFAAETERIVKQIQIYSEGNITVAKGLIADICLAAARFYFRTTGDELGLGRSIDEILEDVFATRTLKEAADYMNALTGTVRRKLGGEDKGYSLMVKNILAYINTHYAEPITLSSVSSHFGLSAGYMSRLLRTETGINFVELVSRARIEAAKRLLRDPRYKVNEVGEMVGYKEYAYFYQVFKRIEGCSPKEYKNQSRII